MGDSTDGTDWDHLVSFVVAASNDLDLYEDAIAEMVTKLHDRFHFFEILLVVSDKTSGRQRLLKRLAGIAPQARLLIVNGSVGFDDLAIHGFRECIGDIVVMAAAEEVAFLNVTQLVDPIILGARLLRIKRPNNTITGWLGSRLLRVITGFRVDTRFLRTLSVSRQALTEILTSPEKLVLFRFTAAGSVAGHKVVKFDYPRARRSIGDQLRRLDLGARLVMSSAPRLLRYAAILCASLSVFAFCGLFYALAIWTFKNDVMRGWTSTTLILAIWMCAQLAATSILCLGVSHLLQRKSDRADGTLIEDITIGDLFAKANFLNVEIPTMQ